MTATTNGAALVPHTAPVAATRLGQATAVEQARAIAEVQAAIIVAQQCPRNMALAIDMMRDSCQRKELAERAFFSYQRGGETITGPSIHLARELARVWGNVQYGLRELRRDEEASEMLAFAWDVQTNTRCDNVIINPHRLYTSNAGRELTQLRDIYENNANVGARRVREAIFAVLPTWFTEEAVDICNRTLVAGDGTPLPVRVANAITAFSDMGVTLPQIEAKHGPSARWTERDIAQLRVTHKSITRGEISKDDAFPAVQERTTVADLVGDGGPASPAVPAASPEPPAGPAPDSAAPAGALADALHAEADRAKAAAGRRPAGGTAALGKLLARIPLGTAADITDFLAWRTGRPVTGLADLTADEATAIGAYAEQALTEAEGDTEQAASAIWTAYRELMSGGSQ